MVYVFSSLDMTSLLGKFNENSEKLQWARKVKKSPVQKIREIK